MTKEVQYPPEGKRCSMKHQLCMKMLCLVTIVLLVYLHQTDGNDGHANEWAYGGTNGPNHWHVHFPQCGGYRQSPVTIRTNEAIVHSNWLVPFRMKGYESRDNVQMHLENNGHTVQINLQGKPISITRGGLKDVYIAKQIHFHWGKTDERGSEHNIDGKYFPMEMHIVHYSTKYKNVVDALDKEGGLAVLAFLFKVGEHNDHLDQIINHFPDTTEHKQIETLNLRELLPENLEGYYRYYGSLTTPPCYESVIWSIFYETIEISKNQLKSFRESVHQNSANETKIDISDHFRPPQRLNQRKMYCSRKRDDRKKTAKEAKGEIYPAQQHLFL